VSIRPARALRTENPHKPGNMAVLVNALRTHLANFENVLEAATDHNNPFTTCHATLIHS
jgi:hypothetical protein